MVLKMKNKSIPSKIMKILTKESRLTINEIFEKSELPIERKEYVRCCANRLLEAKRIAKDGKNGKEYLYSLKDNVINKFELLKRLHSVMVNRMDFIEEPNENEIKNIKDIESEPFRKRAWFTST